MFGEVVLAHRRRLGLSQEQLAARTGLSPRTIRDVESDRGRVPRPASVRRLADAFGLTGVERERFISEAAGAARTASPVLGARTPPAQLPSSVPAFTGRAAELARLDALLAEPAGDAGAPALVISAVSGTAGVGKTALAVYWAHRVRDRFPDGQLYLNLRGYDPDQPMVPGDALARLLTGLGLSGPDIPLDLDERADRYRTEVAGRRMLILLDNASTVEQIRPLLPGTSSCLVLVTSRDSLAGLVARDGARRLDLDLLPPGDAVALLRQLLGDRVDAAPDAATALATRCARLPLALRVAAELAVARSTTPLADLVEDLADQQRRLDLLNAGGDPRAAVAAVFSWSLRHLPVDVTRMFRLLGAHPGPDFDVYAAAALAGTTLAQTRAMLDRLHRGHLIQPAGTERFGMHDLLRAYAVQQAEPEDGTGPALDRLFDYYLGTSAAAMDLLFPAETHLRPEVAPPATPSPDLPDPDAARRWLDAERPCLVATAASRDRPRYTLELSMTLYRYLDAGHAMDALAVHEYAWRAAEQTSDTAGLAHARLGLGGLYLRLGRFRMAIEHLKPALALYRRAGDVTGEARSVGNLANAEQRLGRYRAAAEHHEQALALFRRIADAHGEGLALGNLGVIESRLGRYEAAAEHLDEGLALHRKAGDRMAEALALNFLGDALARMDRHEAATSHFEQAFALYHQIGNRDGEAWTLINAGAYELRLGNPDLAAAHHERALALFREVGDRDGDAWALNGLGDAALAAGQAGRALAYHTEALAVAADIGTRDQQAHAHAGLGRASLALGDVDGARRQYELALADYIELDSPHADQIRAELAAALGGR